MLGVCLQQLMTGFHSPPPSRERSLPPRFASHGTYEEVACQKWKQLLESQETRKREQQKTFRDEKEALEKELDSQRGNVEAEMYRLGKLNHSQFKYVQLWSSQLLFELCM